jgi:peptide deformylase
MNEYDRILLWSPDRVGLKCPETSAEICRELDLCARLLRTCIRYGGVGVAAPQIGVNLRAVVINYAATFRFMINPEIVSRSEEGSEFYEGCLSLPLCTSSRTKTYEGGKVARPDKVTVRYLLDTGEEKTEEFVDFVAHVVQHEIEHLDGIFYVDHLSKTEQDAVFRKFRRFRKYFEVKMAAVN